MAIDGSSRAAVSDPVTKLVDADTTKEVAVFGAVWIKASPSAYVDRVKDIERFERGGAFIVTKRISNPPKAEDFAALEIPDDNLDDLRDCRVSDCELKLGANAIQTLRAQVRILLPDPSRGPGFWFITVNRSRSDGLSGFVGRFVRDRVRDEVRSGTLAALTATKTKLEASSG